MSNKQLSTFNNKNTIINAKSDWKLWFKSIKNKLGGIKTMGGNKKNKIKNTSKAASQVNDTHQMAND